MPAPSPVPPPVTKATLPTNVSFGSIGIFLAGNISHRLTVRCDVDIRPTCNIRLHATPDDTFVTWHVPFTHNTSHTWPHLHHVARSFYTQHTSHLTTPSSRSTFPLHTTHLTPHDTFVNTVLFWEYPLFTAVAKAQLTTVKVGLLKAPNSVNQLIVIKKTVAWER